MSTTLSDLLVRLDLDSAKFREGLGAANKSIEKLGSKVDDLGDGMSTSVAKGVAAWDILKSAIGSVFDFVAQGMQDYAEAEQHTLQLASALKQLKYDADAMLGPLTAQAAQFERTTLATAEQVSAVQQLLLQYGVAPKDIERTTEALLDWSAATGKDAVAGAEALGRALDGEKDGVKALGVAYESAGDRGKDLDAVVQKLSEQFGGQAQAAAEGMAGKIHNLSTAWGDVAEGIAGMFATLEGKYHLMERLAHVINNLRIAAGGGSSQEDFDKNAARINELVGKRQELIERNSSQAHSPQMAQTLAREIDALNKEIRELQQKNIAIQKANSGTGPGGGTHLAGESTFTPCPFPGCKLQAGHPGAHSNQKEADAAAAKQQQKNDAAWAHTLDMAEQMRAAIRTPFEVWEEEIWKINSLLKAGALDPGDAKKLRDQATDARLEAMQRSENERAKAAASIGTRGNPRSEVAGAQARFSDGFMSNGVPMAMSDIDEASKKMLAGIEAENAFVEGVRKMGDVFMSAVTDVVGQMGGAGEILSSAIQGAQSGGVWGAIIAALVELFKKFEGFTEIVDQGNGALAGWLEMLAPVFRKLVDAIKPLLAAVSYLVEVVLQLITPILDAVIPILNSLTPILWMVGQLLSFLQPLFEFLGVVIQGIIWVLDLVLRGVFEVFRGVGFVILGIAWALGTAWNGILSAIEWVINGVVDAVNFITAGVAGLKHVDWSGAKADTKSMEKMMGDLANASWDVAQAKSEERAATEELTGAVQDATEEFLNMPSIFKTVRQRFRAADGNGTIVDGSVLRASDVPHFAEGGVVSRATMALVGEGGERELIAPESMLRAVIREEGRGGGGGDTYIFNVAAGSGRELFEQFKRLMQRERFAQTGFSVG